MSLPILQFVWLRWLFRLGLWTRFLALPVRCQQVLRLVAAADRPDYRAIASLTGMKVTAVGITRGRCLAKLRNLLEDDVTWESA